MQIVADLHSHSRYARAVSQNMVLPQICEWCQRKGINLVATGDWTHPLWLKELETQLEEAGEGVYQLKTGPVARSSRPTSSSVFVGLAGARRDPLRSHHPSTLFLLSTEVAAIYSQGGRQRRIHLLIFVPNFAAVEKINKELARLGVNLFSDGRPILGMSARDVVKVVMDADERCLVIPAHCWTPWFSLYGSMSGFDSIEECFGDLSKYIYGIETGLSSDPEMNWRISDLDKRAILSFSDAHSPQKMGREMTVFEVPQISYENIRRAIISESQRTQNTQIARRSENQRVRYSDTPTLRYSEFSESSDCQILYTIEFYPEEGKYHYTGHRSCGVRHSPEETKKLGVRCPRCERGLTVGVMHRVEQLAGENQKLNIKNQNDNFGVRWIKHPTGRPHYVRLVPLLEILAESLGSMISSQKVILEYKKLTKAFENEVKVLLQTKPEEVERLSGPKVREAIEKVRRGDIFVEPGFDGEYGKVKIWGGEAQSANLPAGRAGRKAQSEEVQKKQMGLF